nr:collagen alpha-1(XXVII) chain B-like isoform X3 [Cherax quadricarinatus]
MMHRSGGVTRKMMLKLLWLLMLLLEVGISQEFTNTSSTVYQLYAENQSCGTVFKSTTVFSVVSCALICTPEWQCVGFGIKALGGSWRVCEMVNISSSCVSQPNFNFYLAQSFIPTSSGTETTIDASASTVATVSSTGPTGVSEVSQPNQNSPPSPAGLPSPSGPTPPSRPPSPPRPPPTPGPLSP